MILLYRHCMYVDLPEPTLYCCDENTSIILVQHIISYSMIVAVGG